MDSVMTGFTNLAFGTGVIICYRTGQFAVSLEAGAKKKVALIGGSWFKTGRASAKRSLASFEKGSC